MSGKNESAIALVITLLMLSVITFLAIAFLAMTKRDRSAVTATLDVDTAKAMSDAALARAQTEIIAQMMATNDILSYDYMASHNFVTPATSFNAADPINNDSNNVNYDSLPNGSLNSYWAQNIGNLFYDPRPPVFVVTNGDPSQPLDFRYWVDINRNGRFESNGYVQMLDGTGSPILNLTNFYNGEPEWIGVLKYPESLHSFTNQFIGRYAYMVLPIGKTLDWNFIHNYSKGPGNSSLFSVPGTPPDGFTRDAGVGSWELNLAALLNDTSSTMYPSSGAGAYNYFLTGAPNSGNCFADAVQFICYRYAANLYSGAGYPQTLPVALGITTNTGVVFNINEFGANPNYPFDYTGNPATDPVLSKVPWPGSYNTNMFYDVQDIFDPNKTGNPVNNFATRLQATMTTNDSYDRYTMQRLLATIGTSSAPEYGVYVYANFSSTNPFTSTAAGYTPIPPPSVLRTKVNINYDNTAQIQASPYDSKGGYTPMPTNLAPWTPLGFFTNAAESLLRSQIFVFTNYVTNSAGVYYQPAAPYNMLYTNFDITNIPVYDATRPGIVYNEQVHRVLQLAANIYAAAHPVYSAAGVPQPPVFRPQFKIAISGGSNTSVTITGFVQVTNDAANQISQGFFDLTNSASKTALSPGPNFWGVPWVVGAVKGLPAFDQYSYQDRTYFQRQLIFVRQVSSGVVLTNQPPQYTNQFYEMSISNTCAMDAWNPYTNAFYGSGGGVYVAAYNIITTTLTNNYNWGTSSTVTNFYTTNVTLNGPWLGHAFKTFLPTNFVSVPFGYYSESQNGFVTLANPSQPGSTNATFLPQDMTQTTFPTHSWSMTVTNHLYYALFDGNPISGATNLLDFVNLGPFGSSFAISQYLTNHTDPNNAQFTGEWVIPPATDAANNPNISQGVIQQIHDTITDNGTSTAFLYSLQGKTPSLGGAYFEPQAPTYNSVMGPFASFTDSNIWMACDPLVHYTIGDLTYPAQPPSVTPLLYKFMTTQMGTSAGSVTLRYKTGIANANIVFGDPGMTSADKWQFPTNLFPGVGWLGRVHRGTPWQTVYLKPDDPNPPTSYANWFTTWVNSPYTYPTNDWSLVDLFTAVPNDNAARGLLSVNQTNDAAWAAVFAGVIALTNSTGGVAINPTNDVYTLMDSATGINVVRTNQPNGIFHKIGDILQASALTTNSAFLANTSFANQTDEMVERIPQQTLSLLKVGLPQFVIYSWGQSLRPKNLYSGSFANLNNICTNYEITGEFLTRTVCHVVGDPAAAAPKIVIDNFNIEPGN